MKKSLLFAFAMCGAVALNAMEPLTPEQLAKLTVQINTTEAGAFNLSSAVQLEYPDASNPTTILVQNFNSTGMSLRMAVNWETETVSIVPYAFDREENYDTGETFNLMVVTPEAANLSSPMDAAFSTSKVLGKISESSLTLDPWNIVKVTYNFQSMTKKYDENFTTKFLIANATMSEERLEWDDDWENLLPQSDPMEFRVFTEVNGTTLTVYNWDDMPSLVKLTQNVKDGVYTYSSNPKDIIFNESNKRDFFLCTLPGTTWDDIDGFTSAKATPLVSNPITNNSEITFNGWIIVNFGESYNNERSFGKSAKLTLDTPLQLGTSGVEETVASSEPIKVNYFNLNGVETAAPAGGIFVKVSTYADGSVKAVKVAK